MRILVVLGQFPSLSTTFVLNQITGLLDRGHEVRVWPQIRRNRSEGEREAGDHPAVQEYRLDERTIDEGPPDGRLERIREVVSGLVETGSSQWQKLLPLVDPLRYGRDALSLRYLHHGLAIAGEGPFDLVHAHFGPYGRATAAVRRAGLLDAPMIVSFHGFGLRDYVDERGPSVYRELFREAELLTVNSNATRRKVEQLGGENIVCHPVGLEIDEFTPSFQRASSGEPVELLTVARLAPEKGLAYAIRAVARLVEENREVRYRIVGGGPSQSRLENLVEQLGVGDRVELAGWKTRDQVREAMQASDIFVLPSLSEGQGLVLQEAQACGLPVVATRRGGIPEGVIEDESALLVEAEEVEPLADRLEELIDDPARRSAMGRIGRRFVEEQYDIRKLNDRLVDLYASTTKPCST